MEGGMHFGMLLGLYEWDWRKHNIILSLSLGIQTGVSRTIEIYK